jgi:hypothetical protein
MEGRSELAIRRPPVAPEPTSKVRAEHRDGIAKAAPAANAVDRRGRGDKDPLFVEADRQRNRVRPELHRRRAERLRRLERMPPLHAPMAGVALTHVDVKAPYYRRDGRQIFLILARCGSHAPRRRSGDRSSGPARRASHARPSGLDAVRGGRTRGLASGPGDAAAVSARSSRTSPPGAPARRAASNSSFNRVFSRSRRARSRSTRARSAFSCSSSRRNRAFSRRRSSLESVGVCSARRLTRLLCQNSRLSTSQTR